VDAFGNFSINFTLFVLRWQSGSVQIEELSAIKSDALGAIGLYGLDVFREFNVCR
jgi:hypothetical protein